MMAMIKMEMMMLKAIEIIKIWRWYNKIEDNSVKYKGGEIK